MLKLTERIAGETRDIWLSPLQVIYVTEGARGDASIVVREQRQITVVGKPEDVAKMLERRIASLYQTPDYTP